MLKFNYKTKMERNTEVNLNTSYVKVQLGLPYTSNLPIFI